MTETFAERLRRIRTAKGFTVVDVASGVGVSPGAIRQLESGQVKAPSFLLGVRLANHLDVDPMHLALGGAASTNERIGDLDRRVTKLERAMVEHHGYLR